MKKRILLAVLFVVLVAGVVMAAPKTEKIKVKGHANAYLYVRMVYETQYWREVYITYEDDKNTFDEAEAESILYEYISHYKIENKFSRVEVEDFEGAKTGEKTTTMTKRVVFRQIRK